MKNGFTGRLQESKPTPIRGLSMSEFSTSSRFGFVWVFRFALVFVSCACSQCSEQSAAAESRPPNIVLLFADDAGYADFGFHGSRHFKTPHLDKLAESGVLLKQLYTTASVCGPSRAGMLTGRYQQRFGFEENNVPSYMSKSGATGDDMGLPLGIPTIADHLKALGYRTALFGKWHQGNADRFHPTKRGFDEFFGFRDGARNYFPYKNSAANRPSMLLERGFGQFQKHEGYLTDALADEACAFIESNEKNSFFAFVSFNAVHTPMQPDPKDKGSFPELSGKRRKLAAMALSLDRACGKILDQLQELGLAENTLVVFTNDNGGPTDSNSASNYPLSGTKATHLEGGIRVPGIAAWPGKIAPGTSYEYPVSTLDFLPTFVELAGGDADAIEGLDGVDLSPYLSGENTNRPHQTLYWKKENRGTIRDGDWKLLRFPDRPAMLFNIADDPAETNDLANDKRELVKELYKKLFAWESGLERPLFQLRREWEVKAAERFDNYRIQHP